MTPDERELDPASLRVKDLVLYRLAKAEYANLSGAGAALIPGRWNLPGQEALYCSTEVGVPVLERLVHTPKGTIPTNLAMMQIVVSGDWELLGSERSNASGLVDRNDRAVLAWHRSLAEARRAVASGLSKDLLGLAVPSVIVPVWNVVLFPGAPGFWEHVSLTSVERFEFDPRLFPEAATLAG